MLISLATVFKKKGKTMFTVKDAEEAVKAVAAKYGNDLAKTVEKMWRLETAHFKSEQYTRTGTAGMVVSKGWPKSVPQNETVSFVVDGKKYTYLVWNPKDFAMFLAEYIRTYNGNFARWNSLNSFAQTEYRKRVNSVTSFFV